MTIADVQTHASADRDTRSAEVKVWDIAVRIFHWSLVAGFALAWVSGDEWDRIHEIAGYVVGGLIAFRLVWGLVGSKHARFSDFVFKPSTVIDYMRDSMFLRAKRYLGHNPAGGAMVIALLLSIIAVTATGIALTTNTFWGSEWMEELHEVTVNLTLVLIGLHIMGVIFASFQHRENLVKALFTGFKRRIIE